MKPVNLDELDRLHAGLVGKPATLDTKLWFDELNTLFNAFPALSAELRTRRKQVEEARRALEAIKIRLITDLSECARLENISEAACALASLESWEGET